MKMRRGRLASHWTWEGEQRMHTRVSAEADAGGWPPIWCVHGLSVSSRYMVPTARLLAPFYRVYAPDLPGFGRSARPAAALDVPALAARLRVYVVDLVGFGASRGSRFALAEAAGVLAGWMDALGLARASLAGHSMGGYVVAELAASAPERVARLLLVDAAVMPFGRTFAQHGLGLLREMLQLPPAFLPVLVGDALRAGPFTLWVAAQEVMRVDLRVKLARIQAPTLVVWGARDRVVPLALGRALAAAIPHGELAVIDGAGHNAMWDRPAAFNELALHVLAGEPRPPG